MARVVTQLSLQSLQLRVNAVLTSRDVLLCERTRGAAVVECLAVSRRSLAVLRLRRLGILMRETGSTAPSKSRVEAVRWCASSVTMPMRGSACESERVMTTA